MTPEERTALIADYERKLAKRKNQAGYGSNVEFLQAEIARLKAEAANGD